MPRHDHASGPNLEFDFVAPEALEPRVLLAGDINAVLVDGSLTLTGDGASNQVAFGKLGNGNLVVVGGSNTTINGQITFGIGAPQVGDLKINLKSGNNLIRINNISVEGDLTIDTRGGLDTIGIADSQVMGNTRLTTRGGADVLMISDAELAGNLSINTGGGGDMMLWAPCNLVMGDTLIRTGSGEDVIYLSGEFAGTLRVLFGSGRDIATTRELVSAFPVDMRMGGGNDLIAAGANAAALFLKVHGGGGNDVYGVHLAAPVIPDLTSVEFDDSADLDPFLDQITQVVGAAYIARGGLLSEIQC